MKPQAIESVIMAIARAVVLLIVLSLILVGPALAGKNARGALVVHAMEQIGWTVDLDLCGDTYEEQDPGTCENARTQSDIDGDIDAGVIWLLAAFPAGSNPGVTVIYFGIEHNLPIGFFADASFCGPAGSLEVPDPGWPDDWANAGNSVAFGAPVAGQQLFMFYYLAAWGVLGNYLGTGINPAGGYAGFVSDDTPGVLDVIHRFGQVRWFEPGYNECPGPPESGACCFPSGECQQIMLEECESLGGDFLGDGSSCDPNPCALFDGACCFADGHCEIFNGLDCESYGGVWQGEDMPCEPNPCPQPIQACCFSDGTCQDLTATDCEHLGGTPMGYGTSCDHVFCRPAAAGACCFGDETCQVLESLEQCNAQGGLEWIEDIPCEPNPCQSPPAVSQTTWGQLKVGYRDATR